MKHFYIVLFLGLSMHISTFAADERTIIRYVERVQAKLLRAAESANFKTSYIDRRISLDESKEVNANSGVTLNYGMLNYIQSEDELAGLLGHEVAHNLVEYDDDERIESEYFADRLGSFLAAKSGYNPYGLQVLLERIAHDPERKEDIDSNEITHPQTIDRANKLKQHLQDRSFRNFPISDDPLYKSIVSLIYDQSRVTDSELHKVVSELKKLQDEMEVAFEIDDQQVKKKILQSSLEKLSRIAQGNPHLKNYRQIKYRLSGDVFLQDILIKVYPDWLKGKDILVQVGGSPVASFHADSTLPL